MNVPLPLGGSRTSPLQDTVYVPLAWLHWWAELTGLLATTVVGPRTY